MRHLTLLLILLCTMPAWSQNRTALVIGNSDYSASPLNNPVNDARAMLCCAGRDDD
ncbi:hypothetical protein D5085_12510 [Ectothiorhodospiraceae bacterium BW-2]|nr:hypothetical protein D5085_12510 [Ectothiorhodospiraceae bacterium BW-2]